MKQAIAIFVMALCAGCSHVMPAAPVQSVQVRVQSVTPVQTTVAQATEVTYTVVYELNGQQFSVQLPQDPGDYLTLQMPIQPSPATVAIAPYPPYPYVMFVGALYRPLPYVGGVHHRSGGARFGRWGGRH